MGHFTKRHRIYSQLIRRGIHIAVLQETHLTASEGERLRRRWKGQLYYTTFSAFSRGVLIWVRPQVPFQVDFHKVDAEGRFVFLQGQLDGSALTILGLYAPNVNQTLFLCGLEGLLERALDSPLLIGGDFNCVPNPSLDRSHPPLQRTQALKMSRGLEEWLNCWGLTDIWRATHPASREYTFYSHIHHLHTRIDLFLANRLFPGLVINTEILARTHSDHNALLLTVGWGRVRSEIPIWRLQCTALDDPAYKETIRTEIKLFF